MHLHFHLTQANPIQEIANDCIEADKHVSHHVQAHTFYLTVLLHWIITAHDF